MADLAGAELVLPLDGHDEHDDADLDIAHGISDPEGSAANSDGAWQKLFKKLTLGADISRLSVSAQLSSPESALEKADRAFEKGGLLAEACRASDPTGRMLALCRFVLSTAIKPQFEEGFDNKKSHTPILGEHFCSFMKTREGSVGVQIVEQVSHHPAVTCSHAHFTSPEAGLPSVTVSSTVQPKLHYHGNSISIDMDGVGEIRLSSPGGESTCYSIESSPSVQVRNLILGHLFTEFLGETRIRCLESGVVGTVTFVPAGLLGFGLFGQRNRVRVTVEAPGGAVSDRFKGFWDGEVVRVPADGSKPKKGAPPEKPFYSCTDAEALHSTERVVLPPADAMDSRELWKHVNENLRRRDFKAANAEKKKLTQSQRDRMAGHTPRFFARDAAHTGSAAWSGWRVKAGVVDGLHARFRAHQGVG